MKQIIRILTVLFLFTNLGNAQNTKPIQPVKKTVTSKITKDSKTGKVVKTIITTTTTTTKIVLAPGNVVQKLVLSRPSTIKKPAAKTKVLSKPNTIIKAKPQTANKVSKKNVQIVSKPLEIKVETESNSIFANPSDYSASNLSAQTDTKKSSVSVNSTTNSTSNIVQRTAETKKPTKIFHEGKQKSVKSYFGLRGGTNFATVQNAKSNTIIANSSEVNRIGLMGGIFYTIGISKLISFLPEVNFSEQGYKITNGIDFESKKNTAINAAFLLKMAVGSESIKVFINGGPYAGYLLNSTHSKNIAGSLTNEYLDFSREANYEIKTNRFDYGVQGGAGMQIDLGGSKFEFEGRYIYGLADPVNYSGVKPSYIGDNGRNRIFSGTIGLMFPIGH